MPRPKTRLCGVYNANRNMKGRKHIEIKTGDDISCATSEQQISKLTEKTYELATAFERTADALKNLVATLQEYAKR